MLPISKVATKLFDADPHVRKLALRCLAKASDMASVSAEELWRVYDQFHERDTLLAMEDFPQTEASLQRTLKTISETSDEYLKHVLEQCVVDLSFGLLMRFKDEIDATQNLSEHARTKIGRRTELATVAPAQLWDQLNKLADTLDREGYDAEHEADLLIGALARNPEAGTWAIGALTETPTWLHAFAINLLGRMKHRGAVELIYKAMTQDSEADAVVEAAMDALAAIGTPEVVERVQPHFDTHPELRFHFAELVGRVKLRQSETALVTFLKKTSDSAHRTAIAGALCTLPADDPAALGRLREMINQQKWDRTILDLDEDALALFKMVGSDIPELPRWEAAVADEQGRMAATRKAHSKYMKQTRAVLDRNSREPISLPSDELAMWDIDDELPTAPNPTVAAPIRRSSAKVGRNDPCPCGSGKKYKKCCGK